MRVLIDTSYAARGPSGTATYLRGLIGALAGLADVEVVEAEQPLRLPPGRTARGRNAARSGANVALDAAWLHVELPARAARVGATLIHHPLPAYTPFWRGPQVMTVHDLAFERLPDRFDPWWRIPARRAHLRAARRCRAVICVSDSTARDVASRWGVSRERIVVAPHGAPSTALPSAEVPSTGAPSPDRPAARLRETGSYLLYVGDAEPRKNLAVLLAGWRLYREGEAAAGRHGLELVLAGAAAGGTRPAPGLRLVESPPAEELAELVAGATALIHPSLHEGFGLTMLDAMARGVPVIAARAAGSVDVCGDAAAYFDPRTPTELAARIRELEASPELIARLAAAGLARAAELSWAESARRHRDAYILASAK